MRPRPPPRLPVSTALSPLALPLSVQLLIISIAAAAPSHPERGIVRGKWNGVSPLAHYEIKIPPAFLK